MDARMLACDRLAAALSYPCANFRAIVENCERALAPVDTDAAEQAARFRRAVSDLTTGELQELYSQTFDMDPRCALDIGWHVFGESYDRSAFLAMLREDLNAADLAPGHELPDHITHMLRLIGRLNDVRAAECGALVGLALDRILEALTGLNNPYEHLLRAVGDVVRPAPTPAAMAGR